MLMPLLDRVGKELTSFEIVHAELKAARAHSTCTCASSRQNMSAQVAHAGRLSMKSGIYPSVIGWNGHDAARIVVQWHL